MEDLKLKYEQMLNKKIFEIKKLQNKIIRVILKTIEASKTLTGHTRSHWVTSLAVLPDGSRVKE